MTNTRVSRCNYRHDKTRTDADGRTFGGNHNGRQFLWGNFPIEAPSAEGDKLPFFRKHPDKDADEHYCGCMGWD